MEFITSSLAAWREILLTQLSEKFGSVPETTSQKVQSIESKEELDRLLRRLIHANSIEELLHVGANF